MGMIVPTTALPVRKIKHGEKITEPGIYDMPMGWYHADCCAGPSISSSGLRRINTHSALHYWDTSPLNPDRDENAADEISEKEAVRMGRAVHTLLLEPQTYAGLFVTRPPMWTDWRTHAAQKWRADQIIEGKTVIDGSEALKIAAMVRAIQRHPVSAGLLEGDLERSLIWKDRKTGVWLKARPDAIPHASNLVGDLKCLRDVRDDPLRRAVFQDQGYDQQMALVGVGLQVLLGRQVEEHVLVAVENTRPHAVVNRPISHDEIGRARSYLRRAINVFAEGIATGEWPGPEGDNFHLSRNDWDVKRYEREVKYGLVPEEY